MSKIISDNVQHLSAPYIHLHLIEKFKNMIDYWDNKLFPEVFAYRINALFFKNIEIEIANYLKKDVT